jgi:hypothetical protein
MRREGRQDGRGHMLGYYHLAMIEDDSDRFQVSRMVVWLHR